LWRRYKKSVTFDDFVGFDPLTANDDSSRRASHAADHLDLCVRSHPERTVDMSGGSTRNHR
jgi:hypothetical protein